MFARSALVLVLMSSSAHAAAFDDLKGYLASCLRFEMQGTAAPRDVPLSFRVRFALDRCGDDVARLERADGRRLPGDGGLSPSTREVIRSVVSRGGVSPVRY